jgi:hypothetical protein
MSRLTPEQADAEMDQLEKCADALTMYKTGAEVARDTGSIEAVRLSEAGEERLKALLSAAVA